MLAPVLVLFIVFHLSHCKETAKYPNWQPRHVHLSYAENPTEMMVTWSTVNDPEASVVEYGIVEESLTQTATGNLTRFVDGGTLQRTQYIHRVKITGLQAGQKYFYRCGSILGWSSIFHFYAMRTDPDWSPRLAVYGDMGSENPQSLPRLQREAQQGLYDAILHVGDFAYDMYENNGKVGDRFMEQIEPIAGYIPYMTCVGNHEERYNFSHYKAFFSMPGSENNMVYSFNIGPAHIIAISTEFYYFMKYGFKQVALQYEWLRKDLEEASSPLNRTLRPWIITMGHRPMYCSNSDGDDCSHSDTLVRVGLPVFHWYALEPLFYKYGVDLAIWAHEHSYERMWPVYDRQVFNGSYEEPYRNPKAPVHVVTGSAGCRERKSGFLPSVPQWTAFRSNDYGYSRLRIANKTHLYMEQVSDDQDGAIIDSFWLIKDQVDFSQKLSKFN